MNKEQEDRKLLNLEIVIGLIVVIVLFICVILSSLVNVSTIYKVLIMIFGFVQFFVGCFYCLRLEQIAGFYNCMKCGHNYVPTYFSVFLAMHIGRTRYMKCPKCGKWSWCKKVLK